MLLLRYPLYFCALLIMTVIAMIVTPLLPAFARPRLGPINNNNGSGVEPRLPRWLAWFDTPDNSLLGDLAWKATHNGGYGSQVQWLYRNQLYGFKWGPLAAPMHAAERIIHGDPTINRNNGRFGTMSIRMRSYWQWKCVKPIGRTGYCVMLNFGWLLDNPQPPRALYMLSPRLARIKTPD